MSDPTANTIAQLLQSQEGITQLLQAMALGTGALPKTENEKPEDGSSHTHGDSADSTTTGSFNSDITTITDIDSEGLTVEDGDDAMGDDEKQLLECAELIQQ